MTKGCESGREESLVTCPANGRCLPVDDVCPAHFKDTLLLAKVVGMFLPEDTEGLFHPDCPGVPRSSQRLCHEVRSSRDIGMERGEAA